MTEGELHKRIQRHKQVLTKASSTVNMPMLYEWDVTRWVKEMKADFLNLKPYEADPEAVYWDWFEKWLGEKEKK